MSVRHLDMAGIGRALVSPVSRHAVSKWRERYPAGSAHPFPEPDVVIGDEPGVPGWLPDRVPEIETWRAGLPGRIGRPRKDQPE
ncbi:hypothetical protein [Actinokineospora iranica]|uniref:Uncharacterized protein n=1 Tax=Actinokineospora iranica TaxID=1271860 RepID=A0A1G6Y9V1_9PSEU|nr:hypothetical protein [Actinokineospora iranica]SDD86507.1 hypothetical protein SAMN05216174_12078 [Actinokineospora iranica]